MPDRHAGRFLLLGLIAALLAGLAFLPGLPGEFVFDDFPNIVSDTKLHIERLDGETLYRIATSPQISGFMRILPTVTFALDHLRGGLDPATFKVTNIVLHGITALALAWFFRALLLVAGVHRERATWLAPALALAWALHPLQVSSVLYVVQRLQTMGTLFLVLALWAYLQARRAQIEGRSGRTGLLVTLLLWILALGCKEDSALLPAYTLALELTVLRFAAADARLATLLRRGYLLGVIAGAAVFLVWTVPKHWRWDAYPGRDFSTPERLLTQARVLCLYLWQILVPLPRHMPFYYDWLQPSRGLLQPWTTLPALVVVVALPALALWLRTRWPLFALGVLWFFAAHFITSNVVGLELAFEHRNHFALIGAVLAIGSVLAHAGARLRIPPGAQAAACVAILAGLATATLLRAHDWRSNLTMAQAATASAPGSARAWILLCAEHYTGGGGPVADNPNLEPAIEACSAGTRNVPHSLNANALLIVLKSLRGDVTPADWEQYRERLRTVPMTWDNRRATLIMTHNFRKGAPLDAAELLETLDLLVERAEFKPYDLAGFGYFVMDDLDEPDRAMPYFVRALLLVSPGDPFHQQLAGELRERGREDLADEVLQLQHPAGRPSQVPDTRLQTH